MAKVFRFGDFTLDTGAFELRRGPAIIPVEPLVLDLLTVMVEQPVEEPVEQPAESELWFASGIDAATGQYAIPALSAADIVALLQSGTFRSDLSQDLFGGRYAHY